MHPAWYINFVLCVLLRSLLFWRAFRCRLWRHYPFFYAYLTYTVLWDLVFSFPIVVRSSVYAKAYWWSYLGAAILRFGMGAEIQRYVFPPNSPLRRRAGIVVLLALLLVAFVFWMGGAIPGTSVFPDVIRKISLAVAAWVLVVLGLARYYGVGIGRNLWGMAVGLLIYTGSELVYLSAFDLAPGLWPVWRFVHPLAFVFMLIVWTFALWRHAPNPPSPATDHALTREFLSAWQDRWAQVSNVLRRMVKP